MRSEQMSELVEKIKTAWEWLVKVVRRVLDAIKNSFKLYISIIYKLPGYRRIAKASQIKIWEKQSIDKSNNWRKMHYLTLIRNAC